MSTHEFERPSPEQVLNCPMVENPNFPGEFPYDAPTVGVFLVSMMKQLWQEQYLFDAKRPYGRSDWDTDVHMALGKAGLIECTFDEDGFIKKADEELAKELILEAISSLDSATK